MNVKKLMAVGASTIAMIYFVSASVSAQEETNAVRDITSEQVDERQLRAAIASRTLTWLTGAPTNNDYVSIGRVANFFGFVGLRVASGHSLSRRDVAMDTLAILNPVQREALAELSVLQESYLQDTHAAHININRALEGLLIEEAIDLEEFLELGRNYGASEAALGRVIGQRLGDVYQTLGDEQKDSLAEIRSAYISGKGYLIDLPKPSNLPWTDRKELVNTAARFLSWTTGSPEFNDYEVVGKPSQHFGFVSLRVESNHGVKRGAVANEVRRVLSEEQQNILDAAATENIELFDDFLAARALLMRALEKALSGEIISAEQVAVQGAEVGSIEAKMTLAQARAMLAVRDSLSDTQAKALLELREKYAAIDSSSPSEDILVRGRQLFAQCVLCHNESSNQNTAPSLKRIVGDAIASDGAYTNYSSALKNYAVKKKVWSEDRLDAFLRSPQAAVPGTYMAYNGLQAAQDRKAIIAYLKTLE